MISLGLYRSAFEGLWSEVVTVTAGTWCFPNSLGPSHISAQTLKKVILSQPGGSIKCTAINFAGSRRHKVLCWLVHLNDIKESVVHQEKYLFNLFWLSLCIAALSNKLCSNCVYRLRPPLNFFLKTFKCCFKVFNRIFPCANNQREKK